jgi:murein L,D-transpeptidase YcbB/YkuD
VLVNITTQQLQLYENGRPVDSMKVIVGSPEFPTPMIASVIYYATLNPYWNVPSHLVRKTVAPNVLKYGLSYLKSRGYQAMSDWSEDARIVPPDQVDWDRVASGAVAIRIRQIPGPGNSMGQIKFPFENGRDIYLHDTPAKDLFARTNRYLSNGCVRLEDAVRLGRWLLGREPITESTQPEQFVLLPQGVPIYLTYLTAYTHEGRVAYVADVYGLDPPRHAETAVSSVN